MTFIQFGLRSLDSIPIDALNCTDYSNFKYKLKNWFYDNLQFNLKYDNVPDICMNNAVML